MFKIQITVFFLIGCITLNAQTEVNNHFIEQVPELELKPPLTQKQVNEIFEESRKEIVLKTEGRFLPETHILNQDLDSIILSDLITNNSLISFGDFHCGASNEYIQDIFPEILECSYYQTDWKFILLVEIDSVNYLTSSKASEDLDWQLNKYRNRSNVFFISTEEARKLNFYSYPCHLLTDADGRVNKYISGMRRVDYWMGLIDSED